MKIINKSATISHTSIETYLCYSSSKNGKYEPSWLLHLVSSNNSTRDMCIGFWKADFSARSGSIAGCVVEAMKPGFLKVIQNNDDDNENAEQYLS